jgi:hypothetical protein
MMISKKALAALLFTTLALTEVRAFWNKEEAKEEVKEEQGVKEDHETIGVDVTWYVREMCVFTLESFMLIFSLPGHCQANALP